MNPFDHVTKRIGLAEKRKLLPEVRYISSSSGPEIVADGKKVINFSSNNYLGLIDDPRMKKAAMDAIEKYGTGSSGSRLLSGNVDIHIELEKALAEFKGGEAAIVFVSGYSANVGIVASMVNVPKITPIDYILPNDVIISDELNHASIIDGCRLSGRKIEIYRHSDMDNLERLLKKHKWRGKFVVTDGVFSMDGDMADLKTIADLCKIYNATLMVDEAHATGILGENGKGACEAFGLEIGRDVSIIQGTCSKAFAAVGGFAVSSREIVEYLRILGRSYMFSAAMTPATAATIMAALKIIKEEKWRRENLMKHSEYLRRNLQALGYDTLMSQTQIVPILIGEDFKAKKFTEYLFEKGIYGPTVRWPAVEKHKARVRFACMATHTQEHIDRLIGACSDIGKKLSLI